MNRSALLLGVSFVTAALHTGAVQAANPASDHRRFQLEQQQDALNFSLQQDLRARNYDLAPADARRLEALELQQRLEYQQLEQRQRQRESSLRHSPIPVPDAERRLELQRDLFAQERQLELQRFELDRQRLLQSIARQPLQPRVDPGRLR